MAMRRNTVAGVVVVVVALCATPAMAGKDDPKTPPPALGKLLDCRSVADGAARLACFDASVAGLEKAYAGGDIAVVDRADVRKTKRGLFGFNLANIPIFGNRGGDDEVDEVKEITGKIASAVQGYDGGWIVTLDEGGRWQQTSPMTFGRSPRAGMSVVIKRAALGSYKMSIGNGPSVKAKRIG